MATQSVDDPGCDGYLTVALAVAAVEVAPL